MKGTLDALEFPALLAIELFFSAQYRWPQSSRRVWGAFAVTNSLNLPLPALFRGLGIKRMVRMLHQRISVLRLFLCALILGAFVARTTPLARASDRPEIEAGFHLLYELKFPEARAQFSAWQKAHPDDPLGSTSEAASYLFEEFYARGVLTSDFFLDDRLLLGGATGQGNQVRRAAFLAANQRALDLARRQLKSDPQDTEALFALTLSTGMQADFAGLIEKRQLESLHFARKAQGYAKDLLALSPDSADAYLALGAANYLLGCLPAHKRFFLWLGGVRGDRLAGMQQLETAAIHGHYLRPFAKILLALVALREKQDALARTLLEELVGEFPQNPLFASELGKLSRSFASTPTSL